ncbi:synaptonemal complex central element protein 1-like [Ochotona princeps]|uniref:synaptonemal complex central element protein 1-like n=1 Tax=Ochotona princeps TaxID=9978 RepID=UPI00271518FA|nr:synaptonemal complex central element protein 1-like [Ochotona princeps]
MAGELECLFTESPETTDKAEDWQRIKRRKRKDGERVPLGTPNDQKAVSSCKTNALTWLLPFARLTDPSPQPRGVCRTHRDFLSDGAGSVSVPFPPTGPVTLVFISAGLTLKKTEGLVAMVKKLQKEGSLEPQIEDLINRINELQQAEKKSSEEVGEAQALREALQRELDSLNGEKVHLQEILNKKQEALWMLQLHCPEKESEALRLDVGGQLDDLMGQHKDLWEFHMLERRLAREISTLESSKEQLLTEQMQVLTKLREVEERLRWLSTALDAPAEDDGPFLQAEGGAGEIYCTGLHRKPQLTRGREVTGDGEACTQLPSSHHEEDLEPPVELALTPPSSR